MVLSDVPVYPPLEGVPPACLEATLGFVPALHARPPNTDDLFPGASHVLLLPDNYYAPANTLAAAVDLSRAHSDSIVVLPTQRTPTCMQLIPDLRAWTLLYKAHDATSASCTLPGDNTPVGLLLPTPKLHQLAWSHYRPLHLGLLIQVYFILVCYLLKLLLLFGVCVCVCGGGGEEKEREREREREGGERLS